MFGSVNKMNTMTLVSEKQGAGWLRGKNTRLTLNTKWVVKMADLGNPLNQRGRLVSIEIVWDENPTVVGSDRHSIRDMIGKIGFGAGCT